MKQSYLGFIFLIISCFSAFSQEKTTDSTKSIKLDEIIILGYKTLNGIGYLNDTQNNIIYSGKKTEVILVDSIEGNKVIGSTRQILGRIPGLNIVESETGGFVANGFGIRGLNPSQSLEMNIRQNGYTIAADVYGYNETYYLPPMEAVERIEFIKGASSLQFGSQLGGMVNYVLKSGIKNKPFEYTTSQTGGSYGLLNSYHAVGGTIGKFNYFAFGQYRSYEGWRQNSAQKQFNAYAKLEYQANTRLSLGLEFSILRNKIRMPGGLTDEQFEENSQASFRSRNWLESPWNVLTATLNYKFSSNTSLSIKSTYLQSERSLVWFDEPADEMDELEADGDYEHRDVEREFVKSTSTEARLISHYKIGKFNSTFATGFRFAYADFTRREGSVGSDGTDFDLTVENDFYKNDLKFNTLNQ